VLVPHYLILQQAQQNFIRYLGEKRLIWKTIFKCCSYI
jgi:hypothetical protein